MTPTSPKFDMADIGDAIRNQLQALAIEPPAERAAKVAASLDGTRQDVLRLREMLTMEERNG